MTSSLVGSEMCIRDSSGANRAAAPPAPRTPHAAAVPSARARYWRCQCPVSYTHLTLPTICSV
eukprot:8522221-Prorocentrum_lima.AAC.1